MVEEERPITYGIVKPGHGCPGGVPVVKVKDMQDGAIDESNLLLTTPELDYQYRRSRLRTGDLLISIRGSVGRLAEIPESLENANITQDTARLTISPQYNKIYVRGVLESPILQWDMEKNIRGVAVKGINIGYLRELKMPVCSRERQDELAMLYQQSDKSKFISFKSQFIEMFGDPDNNSKNWPLVSLKDCLVAIDSGKSITCENYPRTGDLPAILKLSAVTYGEYQPEENKQLPLAEQFIKEAEVHVGDLLFSRKNTLEYVGMTALVKQTPPKLMMPDLIFRLVPQENVRPQYLHQLINHPMYRGTISGLANGSAGSMPNISKQKLNNLAIPLPPVELQMEIEPFIEQSDKSKFISFKSQFIEMFGDPIENEKGWRTIPLLQTGKCKNGMNYSSKDCGVEMHCLGVADFQDNAVIDDMSVLPMVSLKERPNTDYLLQNGDIVFVRSNGNRALVGRSVVVYPGDEPVVYSGFCIRYRKEREELLTDYLLRFFKTDSVRAKMAGRGANIQNLNQQILAALNIPIPPIEMQKEFSVFVKQSDKSK